MAGSKVGTAWYELRADDAPLRSAVSRAENDIKGAGTRAGAGFSGAFGTGIGKVKTALSGMLPLIGALGAAFVATKIVGFFQDAVAAAREEEAGIRSLDAALRQHVQGWDGSTAAIERTIKAQQDQFAFSDGEQREALGRLVAITGGDVPKSMDLMRQAMDLARFRGISLAAAGDIIGKVYGGNIGILGRYGIQVDRGTTSTEALARIQELAGGQAEAFGQSAEGAAMSAGMAFEDLQEEIGMMLLPVLKDLALFARDVLIPAISNVVDFLKDLGSEVGESFDHIGDMLNRWAIQWGDLGKTIEEHAQAAGFDVVEFKNLVIQGMNEMNMSLEEAERYAEQTLSGIPLSMTDAARNSLTAWKEADLGSMVAEDMAAAAPEIGAATEEGITEPTQEELERNAQLAEEAARAMTADYADEIASGRDAVTQAWDDLLQGAEDEMSETARIAEIQAKLASPALRNALNSEDPYLRAQAISTRGVLEEQLAILQTNAVGYALRTGKSLPDALAAQQSNVAYQAGILASRAVNTLGTAPAGAARHGASTGYGFASGVGAYAGTAYSKGYYVGSQATGGMRTGGGAAYSGGWSLGTSFMNGITSAIWAKNPELVTALNYQRRLLGGSLPEIGPLAGKTAQHGGEAVGDAWAGGAVNRLWIGARQITNALKSIALTPRGTPLRVDPIGPVGPFAPRLGLPHLGGSPTANFGNIVVNINGFSGTAGEIESVSQRLANSIRLRARSAF
jgi:hypothetical protein